MESNKTNKGLPMKINENVLILIGIVAFCILLFAIGFPFWAVFVFGTGMLFTLYVLYLIRGVQVEMNLKSKELEESVKQDWFQ